MFQKTMNENNPSKIQAKETLNTNACGKFIQEFEITVNFECKVLKSITLLDNSQVPIPLSNNIDNIEYQIAGTYKFPHLSIK